MVRQTNTPSFLNSKKLKALPVMQTLLLLLLLLLAGVMLLTEATKERGSSANTTLQAQPGEHHVQKVSHTEWLTTTTLVSYTVLYTHCSYTLAQWVVLCQEGLQLGSLAPTSPYQLAGKEHMWSLAVTGWQVALLTSSTLELTLTDHLHAYTLPAVSQVTQSCFQYHVTACYSPNTYKAPLAIIH